MPTTLGVKASHRSTIAIPVTGLAGWWDASDPETIIASGGAVSQWNDKSGNFRHVTQTVAANKPTTGTRTINGRNALKFTDDWLSSAAPISWPFHVFLVLKSDVGPNASNMSPISGRDNSVYIASESGSGQWYVQGNGYMYFNRFRDTNPHVMSVVSEGSGWNWTSFYDGVQTAQANTGNNWGWLSLIIGGTVNWLFDGLIAEIIIYERVLSPAERLQVDEYLRVKWIMEPGLPVTLGCVGWYDATSLALTDGAEITTWPDKSGGGRHLAKVSTGPVFKTNIQNGKSIVRHDGTIEKTLRAATGANYQQFFVVAKYNNAIFNTYAGLLSGTSGDDGNLVLTGGHSTANWHPTPSAVYYKNGVLTPTRSGPMQEWAYTSVEKAWSPIILQLGQERTYVGSPWNGDVGEVIAYDRILSTVERQQIEHYLKTKWFPPPPVLPSWTPQNLPGLQTWIDASDTASITQTGGAVTQIRDKSGNNRHFVGGTNKPTTGTTTINSRNVLNFVKGASTPGSMQRLTLDAGSNILDLDTYTILFVARIDPVDGARMIALGTTASEISGNENEIGASLVACSGPYAPPPNMQTYTEAGPGPWLQFDPGELVRIRASKQGTTFKVAVNEVEATSTLTTTLDLIRYIIIGATSGAPGHGLIGEFCELVVCNSPLSFADLEEWKNYVNYKWLGMGGGGTGGGATFHIPANINDNGTVEVGKAINAWLETVPNDAVVEFTAGATYWVENTLYCADRYDMVFEGNGARFEQRTIGHGTTPIHGFHDMWPRARSFWIINGGDNLEFRNFNCYGANPVGSNGYSPYMGQAYEEQHAFYVHGTNDLRIVNNYARQTYGDFVTIIGHATQVQVIGNTAQCLGRQGVAVVHGTDILIRSNKFDHIARSAFDAEPIGEAWECRRIVIDDNEVSYFINTFFANLGGGGAVSDITITNNRLGNDAVFIASCDDRGSNSTMRRHNYTIINNSSTSINGSPIAPLRFTHIDNVYIEGNHQALVGRYPSPTDGSVYSGIFTSFDDCNNCTVRNNVAYEYPFTHITTHGIFLITGISAASVAHCGNITDKLQAGPPIDGVCDLPSSIPTTGLQGWWDADDSSTITSSGGKVSEWRDKSDNNRFLGQSDGSKQPTLTTMNSKNALSFDNTVTAHMVQNSGLGVTHSGPITFIVAARYRNVDASPRTHLMLATATTGTATGTWSLFGTTWLIGPTTDDAIPHVFSAEVNGANSKLFIDGGTPLVGDAGSLTYSGAMFSIGVNSPSYTWDGDIAEGIVYDRVLSTVERQEVEQYLKTKWGTP